jgi:hypothetical protein
MLSTARRDSSRFLRVYALSNQEESLLVAKSVRLSAAKRNPSQLLRVYTLNGQGIFLLATEIVQLSAGQELYTLSRSRVVHSQRPRGSSWSLRVVHSLQPRAIPLGHLELYTLRGREESLPDAEGFLVLTPNPPGFLED